MSEQPGKSRFGERFPTGAHFTAAHVEHKNRLYRIGAEYEGKSRLGKLVMRLTSMGQQGRDLKSGRVVYGNHHYPEAVVRAYNEELMASWDD